jgi:hypothetical protein
MSYPIALRGQQTRKYLVCGVGRDQLNLGTQEKVFKLASLQEKRRMGELSLSSSYGKILFF